MRTLLSMWISAEESLPENGSTVLGFRDADPHWGNAAYGMAWREIDDESKPGLRWNESGRPTHWMRLPAPPRDEAPYSVMLWVTDAEREKIIDGLSGQHTLTAAEREAVALMADVAADPRGVAVYAGSQVAATLRGLLERTKTGEK
jgi:hypothetical protein